MAQWIFIGIGAGLASALVYASVTTGGALTIVLFYLGTLPLFIAGLGWGAITAGLAGAVAAGATMVYAGPLAGVLQFIVAGLPVAWLTRLALLSRPVDPADPQTDHEFYPVGRLVVWTAGLATAITSVSLFASGGSLELYRQELTGLFEQLLQQVQQPESSLVPDGADIEAIIQLLVRLLPIVAASLWMLTTLLCFWLGGRVVRASGRLLRPWPDLSMMDFPREASWIFAASLALTFLPGVVGFVAEIAATTFGLAFALLGLAVVHVFTRSNSGRGAILATLYVLILIFGWPLLLLTIVGVIELLFGLRARRLAASGPPPPAPPNV